jgi:hypothetical protein
VPRRLAGQEAHGILSADAVAAVAANHGIDVDRDAIADQVDAALRAADPREWRAALAVGAEMGLRLACLLSTLRDPATATAQGWSAWRRSYLRHWATVDEVHLAGGLLAGQVGPLVVAETGAALVRLGVPTRCALLPWPAWAALIGAVRRLGVTVGEVLAVDLGGSRAKTALMRVPPGRAPELTALGVTRVPYAPRDRPSCEALEEFLDAVLGAAACDVRGLGASLRAVAISVACYLDRNRRCPDRGVYANLPDLMDGAFPRRHAELFGQPVDVSIVHDGTAAAASVPAAGGAAGAVLVLGSAIGVGFPPPGLPRWHGLTVRG